MLDYRRMGNMVRHLENTTAATSTHHLRDLWKSPRGIVLRIETLAVAAIVMTFFLVAFGSCRRWSSRWIVQKGFFAAQALSLSLGTYSIGLMQSSSVRSEMYPIWTVSLFTLFGCIDPVTTYNGLDYKGPLSKVVFTICLYCGYALLMSISGLSAAIGKTAICALSAITFIKGFHRTLALVEQSRIRNSIAGLTDYYQGQASVLRCDSIEAMARNRDHELGPGLLIEFASCKGTRGIPGSMMGPRYDVTIKTVAKLLSGKKDGSSGKENKTDESSAEAEKKKQDELHAKGKKKQNELPAKKKKDELLQSCYDVCAAYSLSLRLQRHFLGLSSRKVGPQPLEGVNYKWALGVVEIELAFLHDMFFTGNAFLHYHQAKTACLWALASFTGICFVGVAAGTPGAVASSRGGFTNVVDTTTADLVITFAILVFLALLQLVQLFRCWTSNWARLAVVCAYARNGNTRQQRNTERPGWRALWRKLKKLFVACDKVNCWTPNWWKKWMSLRWFVATRTDWFDKHYLWHGKIAQYPMLPEGEKEAEDGLLLTVRSDYQANRVCGRMLGLNYIWEVLWDLLGSDAYKINAVRLDEDVRTAVTDFLGQIKDGVLEGSWLSYPGHSDIEALFLPYACAPQFGLEPLGSRYARCVLAWYVATWHCELVEQEQKPVQKQENEGNKEEGEPEEGGDRSVGTDDASNLGGKTAAPEEAEGGRAAAGTRGGPETVGRGGEAAGETDESRKHRLVANALAKYCVYLVVYAPELLPGLVVDTKRVCDHFARSSAQFARALHKDNLLAQVSKPGYWARLYNPGEYRELRNIFFGTRGATASTHPLGGVNCGPDRWKMLVNVWVRMLVYAAPYGNSEAHMRQLGQGGEFITHLWALLYHLSIRDWKPPGSKKPLLGGLLDVTDTSHAQTIIRDFPQDNEAIVVAFLHSQLGRDYYSDELDVASKLVKGVSFYRTTSYEVAVSFHIGLARKRPSLVLIKKEEDEEFTFYHGEEFNRYAIACFVSVNKLPLVTTLTQKTVSSLHGHPIHKLVILLAVANESSKYLPCFKEAAKLFKGKLVFVFVDKDKEDDKQAAKNYFRTLDTELKTELNTQVLAYTREDNMTFPLDDDVSLDTVKKFAEAFLADKLHQSEPLDVEIVVGANFDKKVSSETKPVVLVIYEYLSDPYVDACNKLAKYMRERDINSLVVAKMEGTANWHPRARKHRGNAEDSDDESTVLFYPAGRKKDVEPITFEGKPSVDELREFINKHAGGNLFDPISTSDEVNPDSENGGETEDALH